MRQGDERKARDQHPDSSMDATILFADMVDSSTLSHILEPSQYDHLVSAFQETAAKVVSEVLHDFDTCDSHIEASIRGDELSLIVGARPAKRGRSVSPERLHSCARLALQVAIRLKRRWLLIQDNKDRIANGQPPLGIAIGMHAGPVVVRKHTRYELGPVSIHTRSVLTAEGYAINIAKRVETASRSGRFSRIFLTRPIYNRTPSDFRQAFVRIDVPELKGIPVSPVIYEAKGIGHFDDKAFPKSPVFDDLANLAVFEELIQTNPNEMWLLLDLAHKYFDIGEYDLAAQKYKAVIEVDPDFAPAYAYLGRAHMRHYRFQEARAALERATELDRNQARSNHYLAVCLRRQAILSFQDNRVERAKELFVQALQYHDRACRIVDLERMDLPWARNGLNWTIAQASGIPDLSFPYDLDQAFESSRELLRHVSSSPEWRCKQHLIRHTMGFIRLQQKQYALAMNYLRLALSDLAGRGKDKSSAPDPKGYAERKGEILFHMGLCIHRGRGKPELQKALLLWREARRNIVHAWRPYGSRACDGQYWMHHQVHLVDGIKTIRQLVK